jgi:hypothetical protein
MKVNYEKHYRIIAKRLLKSIRSSARTAEAKGQSYGRTKEIIVDITLEQLVERLKQTDGKCERTGISFPLVKSEKDYCLSSARKLGFNPLLAPSADRIDPNGIYTMSNIQIVIQWYNLGKGAKSQSEADEVMELINNPKQEQKVYETKIETKTNNEKQKTMKSATAELELIKTLIENDASEHALKFYIQRQFSSKVEVSVNHIDKNDENYREKKYGKPYSIRREYFDNNSIEVYEFEPNHIGLKELLNIKDSHAMFVNSKLDRLVENNIKVYCKKAKRGYSYAIDREDALKLKL